jgi:hypothetical protein
LSSSTNCPAPSQQAQERKDLVVTSKTNQLLTVNTDCHIQAQQGTMAKCSCQMDQRKVWQPLCASFWLDFPKGTATMPDFQAPESFPLKLRILASEAVTTACSSAGT